MPSEQPAYRLDELGWLQFERLCTLVLEREAGLADLDWRGHADLGRVAFVDTDIKVGDQRLPRPFAVAVVWVRGGHSRTNRLSRLAEGVSAVESRLGVWFERVLVLTNLDVNWDAGDARRALERRVDQVKRFVVLGSGELSWTLDRHPMLRAAIPSVLGLRDLDPLLDREACARSSLDISSAQALARVFWATRAYERARAVLARHRFVVLTGPPEMGKTAIARMLALAQLTDGWEAHDCNSPDQVWEVFARDRPQVFIADDAFGSTEYRPDAADRWARELGVIPRALDERHWLIWTSRPAPLKAGIRRVQRERGSERFPAPSEVLVDASELDLPEKTLILFRHAKARNADQDARRILRSAGLAIVEHPHFTPERIRRFVDERLGELPAGNRDLEPGVLAVVEQELARPTEAMQTSFRALGGGYQELLIALLDAPAGLTDERELAATMRRHHDGGLIRPPGELIDRLTDHFIRVTPLGIGWVHPSWRDLVIDELREDTSARQRFLRTCGVYGAMLALSRAGGAGGERTLPLLITDADWDALGDRLASLLRELDDHDLARLLAALQEAFSAEPDPARKAEAQNLAQYVLQATARAWEKEPRALPIFLLENWYALNAALPQPLPSPPIDHTWAEVHPPRRLLLDPITVQVLQQLDDWLALVQVLVRYDQALRTFHFGDEDQELLGQLAIRLCRDVGPDTRPLVQSVLDRIRELAPDSRPLLSNAARRLQETEGEDPWWAPHDIAAPPSTESVARGPTDFTRADVERVLNDL